jgi:putative ABC transport system permease protein
VARLAPQASPADARAELQSVSASLAREFPASHGRAQLVFVDLRERLYGPFRPAALLLLGGVSFLLLIACTNVANLALGRVAERRGDIALRLAIGAAPSRILREQLLELGVLTSLGGLIGGAVAAVAVPGLLAVYPDALPRDVGSSLNVRVGALVFAQLAIAALLAGFIPARRACALPAATALAATSGRQTGHLRDRRTREWLLAVQVAFAVALLSVAAVVGVTLQRLSRANPGFDPHRVVTMQLAPPARYTDVASRANFVERALDSIAAMPGVVAAGTTQTTWQPLTSMQTALEVEGQPDTGAQRFVNVRHVTGGYFPALRVSVVEGRAIDRRDRVGAPFVAMVSRSFAEQYWPGQSAVGRRVRRGASGGTTPPWLTIIVVAEDVMDSGLGASIGPTVYLPYLQQNTVTARVTLVVRTDSDPRALAPAIQRAVWTIDAQQPIDAVQTLEDALGASLAQPRFSALLLSTFGLIGLVLACVGVYGVSAYAAAQRTREISIRLALGATTRGMSTLLLRQTLPAVAVGLAVGLLVTVWGGQYLAKRLPGAGEFDFLTAAGASLILSACALVANWIPLRRAARRAPIAALRLD